MKKSHRITLQRLLSKKLDVKSLERHVIAYHAFLGLGRSECAYIGSVVKDDEFPHSRGSIVFSHIQGLFVIFP